eukprot:TRINITY_DN10783_c0_g1_i1.p1 TRINITY_DN10783_c0_g1~~TRINITY_DN10783_c0_g1_i1.p1  ORF type:complete len:724 (+),score=170.05 TRINITY_DN10783_c0_g1_i1:76-2247(+)
MDKGKKKTADEAPKAKKAETKQNAAPQQKEKKGGASSQKDGGKPQKKNDSSEKRSAGGVSNMFATPVLQALVIADSFNHRFCPITFEQPRCLLPLANVPIIEYTLEFLDANGVEEIFVFCCSHPQKIEEYLRQAGWLSKRSVKVKILKGSDCSSIGDALRTVDQLDVIKDTFILVNGDVVSNANIKSAIQAHRTRRETDKSAIMTMVLKVAAPNHRSRSVEDSPYFGIDPSNTQLLYHATTQGQNVSLDYKRIFEGSCQKIDLRSDLYDCRIDICAKEVLLHMQENFDYGDLRTDFVKGVLRDEVTGYKIYTHVTASEYAGEISCLKTYDTVSKDIIQRWSYPLVPDNNFTNKTEYTLSPNRIYLEPKISLAQSTRIGGDTVIGGRTNVGENTYIGQSVVGRNCTIGANCVIEGSYIWDDVVIGNNCHIKNSIVANKAVLSEGVKLASGCVISFGVKIASGVALPEHSKATTSSAEIENEFFKRLEGDELVPKGASLTGDGVGRLWVEPDDEDIEVPQFNYFGAYREQLEDDKTDDSDFSNSDGGSDDGSDVESEDEDEFILQFIKEVISAQGTKDKIEVELNTFRFSKNMSQDDYSTFLMQVFLGQLAVANVDAKQLTLPFYNELVKRDSLFVHLFRFFATEAPAQVALLNSIVNFAACDFSQSFINILKVLYDQEIASEEAILAWAAQTSRDAPPLSIFINAAQPLIDWLQNAEEEDEDDE